MNTLLDKNKSLDERLDLVTIIDRAPRFPHLLNELHQKYVEDIQVFQDLILTSRSSGHLLQRIRSKDFESSRRMALLKLFRRCVAPALDTEMTKKIDIVPTYVLLKHFGKTLKPLKQLKEEFKELELPSRMALAALLGEYDTRGQSGYSLTKKFFAWFKKSFKGTFSISGPVGAGRDIQLSTIYPDFKDNIAIDFVIEDKLDGHVLAIGFARYDATRGGAQSYDRTGGNSFKVSQAKDYLDLKEKLGHPFRIVFLADGPGLAHKDTWKAACKLDGIHDDNVRVVTLKTAPSRITLDWLQAVRKKPV